jgi:hypothetical protein
MFAGWEGEWRTGSLLDGGKGRWEGAEVDQTVPSLLGSEGGEADALDTMRAQPREGSKLLSNVVIGSLPSAETLSVRLTHLTSRQQAWMGAFFIPIWQGEN